MAELQGLAIIVAEANHSRLHAALTAACAAAALGRPVRMFFHGEAVSLLEPHSAWSGNATCTSHGLPTLPDLFGSAADLDIVMMACASGLHLCGMAAAALPDGIEPGGMVAFLADAKADQLLFA